MRVILFPAITIAGLALAGCSSTSEPTMSMQAPQGPAEMACLRAVAAETGNASVTILSSEFSQAATEVRVGVGPTQAPWRCLYSGGAVAEVSSLTNEGFL